MSVLARVGEPQPRRRRFLQRELQDRQRVVDPSRARVGETQISGDLTQPEMYVRRPAQREAPFERRDRAGHVASRQIAGFPHRSTRA